MSRSKAKGTAAETAVVNALLRLGFPYAERRALNGALDLGDITGIPGICWEVKDARVWKAAEWMRETETERVNARADYGILVIKVAGVGAPNADRWLTVMPFWQASRLYGFAGGPRQRLVHMRAVGLRKGLDELIERERHCNDVPVEVTVKVHGDPELSWSLMRLSARCDLLRRCGYGTQLDTVGLSGHHGD